MKMKHRIATHPRAKGRFQRSLGFGFWSLLRKFPFDFRALAIRKFFRVDRAWPSNLVFKRAETADEIEQAFNVAYEAYYDRQLVADQASRLRVTKFHALPTTFIAIAKIGDEVVATMTVVLDSALGLPLEQLWNIDDLRKESFRLAEYSTLAIKRSHRGQRGKLLLPLCGFAYQVCRDYLGVDKIVAAYHPEVEDFYRCVLLFNQIEAGITKHYESVQGAAAVAGWLSLTGVPKNFYKVYGQQPAQRNLFQLFTEANSHYQVSKTTNGTCTDFTFTPELLRKFFNQKTDVINRLSMSERLAIANAYFYSDYRGVLESSNSDESVRASSSESSNVQRQQIRFSVYLDAISSDREQKSVTFGKVLEVSRSGMRMHSADTKNFSNGQNMTLALNINPNGPTQIEAQITWISYKSNQFGLILNRRIPEPWNQLITNFENKLLDRVQHSMALRKMG